MTVRLLTEQNFGFLSLKGGCTGSSESTLVKMPQCCESRVAAQLLLMQPESKKEKTKLFVFVHYFNSLPTGVVC